MLKSALQAQQMQRRVVLILCAATAAFAFLISPTQASDSGTTINWARMIMTLFGGLALFLFGMEQMGDGLKAAAGERMKDILAKFTRNRVFAAITGAIVTAVVQSSSVTTVLVVGFVSAGIMTLTQSIGVIMGANIGTTVTAQIVAFKVEELALLFIAIGFVILFGAKRADAKYYGAIIMGLGLVFYGMGVMSDAMRPLRTYQPFMDLMVSMQNPIYAIGVAALFTALVQSSSATTSLVIVMASQGLVTLEAGIALALGANIGTCVTALLAAIGKTTEAVRASVVHVLFNVIGVLFWIWFIGELAALAQYVSPTHPELSDGARLAADTPRQIANANTLFNIANTIVLLAFAGTIGQIATRLTPERRVKKLVIVEPRFLDRELTDVPALALERVRLEIGHMGEVIDNMLQTIGQAFEEKSQEAIEKVRKLDDSVDILQSAIFEYLGQIRKGQLTDSESETLQNLLRVTANLEATGDLIADRIGKLGVDWIAKDRDASDTMRSILGSLYATTCESMTQAVKAVVDNDQIAAQAVLAGQPEIEKLVEEALSHQSKRIEINDQEHLETIRMEMELVDILRSIHKFAEQSAKTVMPMQAIESI